MDIVLAVISGMLKIIAAIAVAYVLVLLACILLAFVVVVAIIKLLEP